MDFSSTRCTRSDGSQGRGDAGKKNKTKVSPLGFADGVLANEEEKNTDLSGCAFVDGVIL